MPHFSFDFSVLFIVLLLELEHYSLINLKSFTKELHIVPPAIVAAEIPTFKIDWKTCE